MLKTINPDNELIEICKKIKSENKGNVEWDLVESDDYFQTPNYSGGWDATEQAFCFDYYDEKQEYWFQLTLNQVDQINNKELDKIVMRTPT